MYTDQNAADMMFAREAELRDDYAHVLEALGARGLAADLYQSGGGCFVLSILCADGRVVCTDLNGCMSDWGDPDRGWLVGVYFTTDDTEADRYLESRDGSVPALLDLVRRALDGEGVQA